jgi:O-acetyl-ADP-ribose deacetylase (regulator of RNase III)
MALQVVLGDITEQHVDAIVNAANSSLLGGGGVDGAIHSRGGPAILAECRELRATRYPNGLPVGQAVATTAGELPARWVIHTVGPIHGRGEVAALQSCYTESLRLADELGATSIAGAYGWPVDEAIVVADTALSGWAGDARLVLFSRSLMARARAVLGRP